MLAHVNVFPSCLIKDDTQRGKLVLKDKHNTVKGLTYSVKPYNKYVLL